MSEYDALLKALDLGLEVESLPLDRQRVVRAAIDGASTPPLAKALPDAERDLRVMRSAPRSTAPRRPAAAPNLDAVMAEIGTILKRATAAPRPRASRAEVAAGVRRVLAKALAAQQAGALTAQQVGRLEVVAHARMARIGGGR